MSLCLGSQPRPGRAILVPIPGPEQPHSSPEDTRGVDQSLHALAQLGGFLAAQPAQFSPRDKPKFMEHRHCTGGIVRTDHGIPRGATALLGPPARRVRANCQRRHDEKAIGFGR